MRFIRQKIDKHFVMPLKVNRKNALSLNKQFTLASCAIDKSVPFLDTFCPIGV